MRFKRLQIPAYGPFTNLELKFPSNDHDFHVIYGENEAGKSSLLRAIRDLLFGIHGQTPDNFLHDYKNLRLLGEIVSRAGDELVFQRRKGNTDTLLDKEGNALADSAILAFLGSVDQSYFSAMFGLGTRELREGAEELLRGEGEIGNALFSTSMGGTPVQRVLDSLEEESDRLYKGRATTKVSIRPAVSKYKELHKQCRDAMVNPETWDELERELAEQNAARKQLDDQIALLDRDIAWISRCEDALPTVGRLNEETRLLAELPELPAVASDFVERAGSARNAVNESNGKVEDLAAHTTQLEGQLANCATSPTVLLNADALDALHQDLGAYRTRKQSLVNLKSKLAGIEPVLRAGMKSLEISGDLESLETLRLSSAARMSCEEAAKALQEAVSKRNENRDETEKLKEEIESLENEVKSLPETDLTPLREALAVAAGATEADKTLAVSQAVVEDLFRTVTKEHTLVLGAPEDLDATAALPVPATSTIRKFHDQFDGIGRDIKGEKDKISKEGKNVHDVQAELSRLERRGELPSEQTLHKARSHRDHGWQLVLADWKGAGAQEELDPGSLLEEAFPKAIIKADDIADQLRLHAEAVAQAEEKRLQIQNRQAQIAEANEALGALQRSLKECEESWEAEWSGCGIKPRSPDEMAEWRETWVQFRRTLDKLRNAEAAVKTKTDHVQQAKETLADVLGDSHKKDFSVLFEAARSQIQQGEELTGRRDTILGQLQDRRKQLESFNQKTEGLRKATDTATANWKSRCQTVGLPDNTSPEIGLGLLQERKELLTKFDNWKESSGEANKTKEAIQEYEQRVREQAVSLEIEADAAEAQEAGLWQALSQARIVQTEYDQLAAQIQRGKNDLKDAQQAQTQTLQALKKLMQLGQLNTVDELEPLLANLERRSKIQSGIDSCREMLGGRARGQSVDEFVALVQAENAVELPQRKTQLAREKEEKKSALQSVQDTLSRLNQKRQELEEAGDAAANFRQQAESVAAALKQDASRFLRLRLAVHLLRAQIEQFREENQGPLLEKSGQVFKQITRGAFDGLGAEFNAQDVPVMVGRREDGANVPVEGMSDGSRDQLYLALRLAALDRYLAEHEPMPLILDDLLTTFDDERAKAILPQLAGFAKRTQIFLFTHHEHLVKLCQQTLGEAQFTLHELVNPHPSKTT